MGSFREEILQSNASWWHKSVTEGPTENIHLPGDTNVDIAIVGAGYSGLWTAYYLKRLDPGLDICIVESHIAGYGASGRNGGWCLGSTAATHKAYESIQPGGALRMARAMHETLDEIEDVLKRENIDCHYAKGGTIFPAINRAQVARLKSVAEENLALGLEKEDYQMLTRQETLDIINTPKVSAGLYTPHCAAIHPYRLVTGLVDAVRKMGVKLYENTKVTHIHERQLETNRGAVHANVIVRATEAYTGTIKNQQRKMLPLFSYMVVTEQIKESDWNEIGLSRRETFEDARRFIYYGQRTADDRIAIGGLVSLYRFGSATDNKLSVQRKAFARLERLIPELFPCLSDVSIEHRWSGVFGIPRNRAPSVGHQPKTGLAWASGYMGRGVAATNLAGRSLANLICENKNELTSLPWVNSVVPDWEPEPLRWLGVQTRLWSYYLGDWIDSLLFTPKSGAKDP